MDTSERAVVKREPQRRRWPVEEKCRIVEQTLKPGASVARVALAHGVNANQVFSWRRHYRQVLLGKRNAGPVTLLLVHVIVPSSSGKISAARRPPQISSPSRPLSRYLRDQCNVPFQSIYIGES